MTNNTHETSLGEILRERSYFHIPPFQREYKWKPERIDQFTSDVQRILDGEEDAHFLGAFIIDALPKDPNSPASYEVIDGQQRITTFYLLIAAACKVLLKNGHPDLAADFALEYLFTRESIREGVGVYRTSLIPSIPDQADLNFVIEDLLTSGLKEALTGYILEKLHVEPDNKRRLSKNYELLRKFLSNIYKQAGADGILALKQFVTAAQAGLTVVQILVKDPTSGPKIYDSLNSKQEPMTTGDLVRNEVFGKVARNNPSMAQGLDRRLWQPFYDSFERRKKSYFEGFFFPFGLIKKKELRKSEVFNFLRDHWATMNPEQIMQELGDYQLEYQDLVFGENKCNLPNRVATAVLRLNRMDFPKVALPFLMEVIHARRNDRITDEQCLDLLFAVESFLVRRALCSMEPTGLHAVFKKLWSQLGEDFSAAKVKEQISNAKTVKIPSDAEVKASFDSGLYGKGIDKYFLYEFDMAQGGDPGPWNDLWIEHVLPNARHDENWPEFDSEEHGKLVNLAGNLLPLSEALNREAGQAPFADKRVIYREKSAFKSARDFADRTSQWTPSELRARNEKIANWTINHWIF